MAKISVDDLIAAFEEMTLLELKEFRDRFKDHFDVQAAAAVAVAAPGAAGGEGEGAAEQTEFDVVLTSVGDKKIGVIKEVRGITSLGLKEAKELCDNLPKPVLEGVAKEEAEAAKAKLEEAGASVELK